MAGRIQLRRDTAANWAAANPILAAGEKGLETDTGREKNGNGVDRWNDRPYVDGVAAGGLAAHLADTSDAHAASAIGFTPTASISATTVQAAIAEVDAEHVNTPAAPPATVGDILTKSGTTGNGDTAWTTRAAMAADPAFSGRYAPIAVDQFVDPFPSWFGGGTVNESIADIVTKVDAGPASLFVPATSFANIGGSPTLDFVITPTNALFRVPVWLLSDAESDFIGATIPVPAGWSTADVHLWWTNPSASSGNVSIGGAHLVFGDSDTTNAGSTTQLATADYAAPAQYVARRTKINSTAITVSGDPLLHLGIVRSGTNGGDTLAANCAVIGVELVRVS